MNDEILLIKRASDGDERAFEELVTKYQSFVYRLCLSALGSREDALDVSQEVFIRMWRSLGSFKGNAALSTWLYRIVQNAINDHFRKKPRSEALSEQEIDDIAGHMDTRETASPEKSFEKSEVIREVRLAVNELSCEHREAVILRDIEGFSYLEIAEMTGLSEGTVKSRISRARSELKNILGKRNIF